MQIIELVNKYHFSCRCGDNKEMGDFLYDQMKALLDLFGKQIEKSGHVDIQYFSYVESGQESICYEISDDFGNLIRTHFLHQLKKAIEKYGEVKRKEGTEILFQLNKGNISMKDFNDKI